MHTLKQSSSTNNSFLHTCFRRDFPVCVGCMDCTRRGGCAADTLAQLGSRRRCCHLKSSEAAVPTAPLDEHLASVPVCFRGQRHADSLSLRLCGAWCFSGLHQCASGLMLPSAPTPPRGCPKLVSSPQPLKPACPLPGGLSTLKTRAPGAEQPASLCKWALLYLLRKLGSHCLGRQRVCVCPLFHCL